jgi:hypothetical protein
VEEELGVVFLRVTTGFTTYKTKTFLKKSCKTLDNINVFHERF